MKRTALVILAIAIAGAACKKENLPTNSGLGQPTTFTFSATALPANEIPPVSNAENVGRAFANATLKVTRDGSGNITGGTLDYGVAVSGFPAGTNFTNMHIHRGDATVASGAVVINSGLANGELALTNGAGSIQKTNNPVGASLAAEIIANPGGFYFNIHTTNNQGGVARGQLVAGQAQ